MLANVEVPIRTCKTRSKWAASRQRLNFMLAIGSLIRQSSSRKLRSRMLCAGTKPCSTLAADQDRLRLGSLLLSDTAQVSTRNAE